jgi:hypothetical protein
LSLVAAPADQAGLFVAVTVTRLPAACRRPGTVSLARRLLTDHFPANAQNIQFWRPKQPSARTPEQTPDGACEFMLVGLANHAGLDGRVAFPISDLALS